jgi:hypothetical protein
MAGEGRMVSTRCKIYGEMAINNMSKIGDMSRIDSGCENNMDGEWPYSERTRE